MPKISALTSLAQASVDTAADVLPIVDATAPATTKKVTAQALVNAGAAAIAPQGGVMAVSGNFSANAGKLNTYTYATLPAASSLSGYSVRVSDVGVAPGMVLVSDGTRWLPDGVQVLGRSAVPVSGAADTSENTLATITVPAGLLGVNGSLRTTTWTTVNNNANTKTLRVRYSGGAGTQVRSQNLANSVSQRSQIDIANRGSDSSQLLTQNDLGGGGWGNTTVGFQTATVNSAVDTTVVITVQKATAGDTMTLERYLVEILP